MLNVLYNDIKNPGRTEGRTNENKNGKSHLLRWLHHLKTDREHLQGILSNEFMNMMVNIFKTEKKKTGHI